MATKHDSFSVHLLSLEDSEIDKILYGLYATGEDYLAEEIKDEVYGEEENSDVASLSIKVDANEAKNALDELSELAVEVKRAMKRAGMV